MESMNNDSEPSLLKKEATLSTLRQRKKRLVLVFSSFFIFLALIIGAIIIILVHDQEFNPAVDEANPAIQAFCSVTNSTDSCVKSFNPIIINTESITDPNQVYDMSLQIAAKELTYVILFISKSNDSTLQTDQLALRNCSISLTLALNQVNGTLAMLQKEPFVEFQSLDRTDEMMDWIVAAEDDLKSCLRDLGEVTESNAMIGSVRTRMNRVMMHVSNSVDFLVKYDDVKEKFWVTTHAADRGGFGMSVMNLGGPEVFMILMVALQLLFVSFLIWSICRAR